jgi:multisubunit Na+/H+ antiporter MnhB subunit
MFRRIAIVLLTVIGFLFTRLCMAQEVEKKIEMADGLRSNGKIYVVVAVLVTILTGIVLYLIRLDRKISKLEKN